MADDFVGCSLTLDYLPVNIIPVIFSRYQLLKSYSFSISLKIFLCCFLITCQFLHILRKLINLFFDRTMSTFEIVERKNGHSLYIFLQKFPIFFIIIVNPFCKCCSYTVPSRKHYSCLRPREYPWDCS